LYLAIKVYISNLLPWTDFCPVLKIHSYKLWSSYWSKLPTNFSSWYRSINPSIPSKPRFNNLNLNRKLIVSFSRLRIGHALLPPVHINYRQMTPLFALFIAPRIFANIPHLIFSCPSLLPQRQALFILINSLEINSNSRWIFSSRSVPVIPSHYFLLRSVRPCNLM